jgi:phosphoribosylanthranilate isomerase
MASVEEAALALRHGATALGFVMRMPSGPGPIEEELAREIIATLPERVPSFLLTCEDTSVAIVGQLRITGASTVQIVDHVTPEVRRTIRRELPAVRVVQVIHVAGPESVDEAREAAETSDMLLLDSGNPKASIKELGGTGRVHDWQVSRAIRESVRVPVWLAGGLREHNVAEAVRIVEPYGVDVCSGVRTGGRLDTEKLRGFVAAARGGALAAT